QRTFFQDVFLRLCNALDVEEADGRTYLDNSLVIWTMESGDLTHDNLCMPIVTAGSGGEAFETGRFLDYRNHANLSMTNDGAPQRRPGLLYNQFLANVMQGMGVAPSEYGAELQRVRPSEYASGYRGY